MSRAKLPPLNVIKTHYDVKRTKISLEMPPKADDRMIVTWSLQILMGFSYSVLACALWPMVAYVVPEHHLGTAYGM